MWVGINNLSLYSDHDTQGILSPWQQRNTNWLQQVDIHCETTKDVKVTVMPFYLGCRVSHSKI